jgi:hypothetical protein
MLTLCRLRLYILYLKENEILTRPFTHVLTKNVSTLADFDYMRYESRAVRSHLVAAGFVRQIHELLLKFSSYHTENILHFHYRDQPFNTDKKIIAVCYKKSYETYKYTMWAKYTVL